MLFWRICKGRHAKTAFSGEGARLSGGRWNPKGVPVAYCASHLSLAVLELFVHVDPSEVPSDLVALQGELPDGIAVETRSAAQLPRDWRTIPGPDSLKDIGEQWARDRKTAVLVVPSAIVPEETNVLLNPLHPDFASLRVLRQQAFAFDSRMWKAPSPP